MLTSKEIARRSLSRAEEIKSGNMRRRRIIRSLAGVGLAASLSIIIIRDTRLDGVLPSGVYDSAVLDFEQPQVPLSSFSVMERDVIPYSEAERENAPAFHFPAYTTVNVPEGTREVTIVLPNPSDNECFLRFEIILTDGGDALFESGLVAPGMCMENLTLNRPLEEGSYDAKIIIRSYDMETLSLIKSVSSEIKIVAGC